MMLQGHFVDIMLDPLYRDAGNPLFSTWEFMRGMTAPIFFTITGIVFTFLLLRKGLPLGQNPRVMKGLRRGVQLIFIGYLLQVNFGPLLTFHFRSHWWELDVLHCIGLALISLIGVYALHQKTRIPLAPLLLTVGLLLFIIEPITKAADWSFLPRFFEHYFTKAHGSAFTPIPWVGYTLIGGVIGWHISHDNALYRTAWWPVFFLICGWLLHSYSSLGLMSLHELSGMEVFKLMAYNNYLLIRLGHVFIVISIFMLLEVIFKQFPAVFLKVGQETLTIYGAHYVLLYGSWLGVGIATFGKYSLTPWATLIGAASFVIGFVLLTSRLDQIRSWNQKVLRPFIRFQFRRGRVWLLRYGLPALAPLMYRISALVEEARLNLFGKKAEARR